jgi:hypothetical protein
MKRIPPTHGFLKDPPSRNLLATVDYGQAYTAEGDSEAMYNAQGMNSGQAGWNRADVRLCGTRQEMPHLNPFSKPGSRKTTIQAGKPLKIKTHLTAAHGGWLGVGLCDVSSPGNCVKHRLKLKGTDSIWYPIGDQIGDIEFEVDVPDEQCNNCMLHWVYRTNNSSDRPYTEQEIFTNCADVQIQGGQGPLKYRETAPNDDPFANGLYNPSGKYVMPEGSNNNNNTPPPPQQKQKPRLTKAQRRRRKKRRRRVEKGLPRLTKTQRMRRRTRLEQSGLPPPTSSVKQTVSCHCSIQKLCVLLILIALLLFVLQH